MIGKPFDKVTAEDISSLIANGVPETKTIEYKRELPDDSGDSRKEFLADVSSFSNAEGGDLLYGVAAEGGIPKEIVDLQIADRDKAILQWENLIRDGIAPRIRVDLKFHTVEDKTVLHLRVQKSWNKPHRVEYKNYHRFYSRNSAGKFLLGIDELRGLFLGSDEITGKVRDFISQRDNAILQNEGIVQLGDKGRLALYLIPVDSLSNTKRVDVFSVQQNLRPPYSSGWNNKINLEGILNYSPDSRSYSNSYVQIYRSGIIEAVSSGILLGWKEEDKFIPSTAIEKAIIESLGNYLAVMKQLQIEPPYIFGMSLINIRGYQLAVKQGLFLFGERSTMGRDILRIPELVIDEFPENLDVALRSTLDLLWNAFGFQKSVNFDENGRWRER